MCGVKPKSCNRGYMHSCIPWILGDFANDPWVGTANDFNCSFWWFSDHVGICSIARPWFLQGPGRLGGPCLHICRWVLPLHYHPQLYIMCYQIVKVGMLIWQVSTKRSSNRIILFLLVWEILKLKCIFLGGWTSSLEYLYPLMTSCWKVWVVRSYLEGVDKPCVLVWMVGLQGVGAGFQCDFFHVLPNAKM